jgi:alpha-tubulin suppressor-like RCC1 family protein
MREFRILLAFFSAFSLSACNSTAVITAGGTADLDASGSSVLASGFSLAPEVVKVAAGANHSCALYNTGAVKCWGRDNANQLGDGTGIDSSTPVTVPGVSNAIDVYAGNQQSCAILDNRSVTCWGNGLAAADAGLSSVLSMSIGGSHACALASSGAVYCWGANAQGQLGDGTTFAAGAPAPVSGYPSPSSGARLAAGSQHSCVINSDSSLSCFGDDSAGELGNSVTTGVPVTTAVAAGTLKAYDAAAGASFTCAVDSTTAQVYCWGDDTTNALGDGLGVAVNAPKLVTGLYSAGLASNPTSGHVCSLQVTVSGPQPLGPPGDTTTDPEVDTEGTIQCWGANSFGQLGNGAVAATSNAVSVSGMTDALQVAVGESHTCALTHTGLVYCWGRNTYGELGDGGFADSHVPVAVTGL